MPKRKKNRIGKTPAEKINWTSEEDQELKRLVQIYGENSWHRLCKFMPNKTEIRCFKRWLELSEQKTSEPKDTEVHKGSAWTPEEDILLKQKVEEFGTQNWVIIARFLNGRLGRQCRERWHNVLNPEIVRKEWTKEEDAFIVRMQAEVGSKWAMISKMDQMMGRTVSQIKNRFYQSLKGKDTEAIQYKGDELTDSCSVNKRDSKL